MESTFSYFKMKDFPLDVSALLVALFILPVILILLLDYHIKSAHQQLMIELQLNKLLWKFLSIRQIQQYKIYLRYNLLKLFLASIIVSVLSYFITSKKYSPQFCFHFSLIVFGIWNVGSLLFYYILNHSKNFQSLQYSSLHPSENSSIKNKNNTNATTTNEKIHKKIKDNLPDSNVNNNINATTTTTTNKIITTTTTTTTTNKSITKKRLPVTVITGFLGAGKTTLVKSILNNTVGLKVLVIENEIGAEGVDHDLLLTTTKKEEILLLNNGCICCTVRNDLIETFHSLFSSLAFQRLDWVVIETTGIADPAPIIQLFYMDSQCKDKLRIDSVITVVDCKHISNHLTVRNSTNNNNNNNKQSQTSASTTATPTYEIVDDTISHQIGYADIIILNKIDLVTTAILSTITRALTAINTTATIHPCRLCNPSSSSTSTTNIDIEKLLNVKAYDPTTTSMSNSTWKTSLISEPTTSNVVFPIIRNEQGEILKRRVRSSTASRTTPTRPSPTAITTTRHSGISTLSVTTRVPLDLDKFNRWMSSLLKLHGEQIFRMKGVLFMRGYDRQFVVQGVHMIFEGTIATRWIDTTEDTNTTTGALKMHKLSTEANHDKLIVPVPAPPGTTSTTSAASNNSNTLPSPIYYSKLVFIGKQLYEMDLESSFLACEDGGKD